MAGHTFAEKRAGNVAVPHIRRTLRGKRGSATHLAPIARETWQCHTSGANCAGDVAVPRIPRALGSCPHSLHERLLLELGPCHGVARRLPRREREQVVFRTLAVADR